MGEQPKPWMNEPWPSGPLPHGNDCLRIQPDTCVEPARLRTTPNDVEVKPEPASGGQGGFVDLRYPSHSMSPFREPADLATEVLDAMTRKLRDYNRLSKALTETQEAAAKNFERARKAEERSNVLDGQARQLCVNIDQLRKALADARAEVERLRGQRDKLEKQRNETGRKLHEATVERDRLFERACKADAARSAEEAARDVERNDLRSALTENDALRKALDDSRALAERLGEAFDCHPGELPRVGRSLSAAMARIAKCVDKAREEEDEVADAVERLRMERDLFKRAADAATLGVTPLRAAKPEQRLTPLRHLGTVSRLGVNEPGGFVDSTTYTFYNASIDVRYAGANVAHWELRIGAWSYSANYGPLAMAKDMVLADVNAVLARFGCVLEAWP